MPRDKDLKRLVRARMRKTGEAYTAARAQILKKSRAKTVTRVAAAPAPRATPVAASQPKDYAALAGVSDRAITERTGCTWEGAHRHGAESERLDTLGEVLTER